MTRTRTFICRSVIAVFTLFLSTAPASASTIVEIEPNNTFATAQLLGGSQFTLDFDANIFDSTTLAHVTIQGTSSNTASYDYFRFTSYGGPIYLDIDSAPTNTNFDTTLVLYNAVGIPLASNDDNGGDPGDGGGIIGGAFNSRIQTGVLPAGDYIAEVGDFGSGEIPAGGTYTLNISANAAPVPEPATLMLLGSGLAGLAGYKRRQRAKR